MKNSMPLFKCPTKIALIDDDELFLISMGEYLASKFEKINIKKYLSPNHIINDIKMNRKLEDCVSSKSQSYKDTEGQLILEYDLRNTFEAAQEKVKDNITVLVVDYSMPSMNGISFLEKVGDVQAYKILLTGIADERKAIDAFNKGIIDCYLKKDEKNVFSMLYKKIIDGQDLIFTKITDTLAYAISKTEKNTLLGNEGYNKIIKGLIEQYGIVYYYLIDEIGSCYMESEDEEYVFYITEDEKNKAFVEYLEDLILDSDEKNKEVKYLPKTIKENETLIFDKMVYEGRFVIDDLLKYKINTQVYTTTNKKYYYFFSKNNLDSINKKLYTKKIDPKFF